MNFSLSTMLKRHRPKSKTGRAIVVEIANRQKRLAIDERRMRESIRSVLVGEEVRRANISLAVVDDATIHELNCRYLEHDYPTDVLSFVLEQTAGLLEGEIIISADTAAKTAKRYGWTPVDELLLYAIHGALHLAGYDDQSATAKKKMRERERFYLQQLGMHPRYEESRP